MAETSCTRIIRMYLQKGNDIKVLKEIPGKNPKALLQVHRIGVFACGVGFASHGLNHPKVRRWQYAWPPFVVNWERQICLEGNSPYQRVVSEIGGMGSSSHESWKDCSYRNALTHNSINNSSNNIIDKCSYPWLKWGSMQEQCGSNLTSVAKPYQGLQLRMVWTT